MINQFLKMECDNNLLSKKIGGFQYWAYIRFEIYMKMDKRGNKACTSSVKDRGKYDFCSLFNMFLYSTFKNPFFKVKPFKMLIVNHPRRYMEDGVFKCMYTEEIANYFKADSCTIEFLYRFKHFKPVQTPNLYYFDYIDVIPAVISPFAALYYKKDIDELRKVAKRINKLLLQTFSDTLGESFIFSLLKKRFLFYQIKKRMFRSILKKASPKIVIEVVGYETNKMIVNELCHELKIPVIEMQHGVMGRGHLAYNFLSKGSYKFFPDKIFLFSEYWKDVTKIPLEEDNCISVGFPYLDRNLEKYKNTEKYPVLTLLVLSQPENDGVSISIIIQELLEKLDELPTSFLQIVYKLHPAEYHHMTDVLMKIKGNKNVIFVDNSEVSLYQYFAKSHIQLGTTSTAVFEGLAFGLDTVIYHLPETDTYMKDLIDNGYAGFIHNINELWTYIQKIGAKMERREIGQFWEKDSLKKITDYLKIYLKEDNS